MDTFDSKLRQKALHQPKQKKSKSAEFLMERKERAAVEGIENPAFDGSEPSISPVHLRRDIQGDRPDSTLAAHPKKLELQAFAGEGGNEHTRNDFDPAAFAAADQSDPRRRRRKTGVSGEDELELKSADQHGLYLRMAELLDEDDCFINLPGTLQALREEEVLEVKEGRVLLRSAGASGPGASQADPTGRAQAGAVLEEGRACTESAVKADTVEEAMPRYAQQLRERVRPDMITLGSLSLQQRDTDEPVRSVPQNSSALFQGVTEDPSPRMLGEGHKERTTELPESSSSQVNQNTQPIEVCVRCLRAVRDKLPRGLYAIRVDLHSRLGGPALPWSRTAERQHCSGTTRPVEHRGCFYNTDMHINQSLFMVLPGPDAVLPCMVLVFRLTALPGDTSRVSTVLAWGAHPVCGLNFCPAQGRFKTPLLRGQPGQQLDQFRKIEGLIASDLDHWLCNMYFQVKRLSPGVSECGDTLPVTPLQAPQTEPPPSPQPRPAPRAAEHSRRGSSHSACSSSSMPGKTSSSGAVSGNTGNIGGKNEPCRKKAEGATQCKKKPAGKMNNCVSGGSPPMLGPQTFREETRPSAAKLSSEEMEEYTFSIQTEPGHPFLRRHHRPRLSDRTRLALRMLPSELGLPLPRQPGCRGNRRVSAGQLGLIMLLLALMWFVRLYLHYCSQWLYLQAMAVPVNKFQFHAHTVDLIYQNSLLHTREELAMVVVGPLTLNGVTLALVLIRWGCQQIFGSVPSFMSELIMAQGVWTVLDPLAVFAVDGVLGRLTYSPDSPVGDAAKLYWHFFRNDQSGTAGVVVTIFLYTVLLLLSVTIFFIYVLRFHNDGRMLDVFQRLGAKEGTYFLPQDLELSNQELSYIVKKAEQWRGFSGERRKPPRPDFGGSQTTAELQISKVAVYDHIWTEEEAPAQSSSSSAAPPRGADPAAGQSALRPPGGEVCTHVELCTLYLSGLRQRYRHFLRHPDGAIVEVFGDTEGLETGERMWARPQQGPEEQREEEEQGQSSTHQLRKRKKAFWRSNRVEPVGESGCGSSFALHEMEGHA